MGYNNNCAGGHENTGFEGDDDDDDDDDGDDDDDDDDDDDENNDDNIIITTTIRFILTTFVCASLGLRPLPGKRGLG